MDTVGSERAVLFGLSEGGPMEHRLHRYPAGSGSGSRSDGDFRDQRRLADSSPDEMRADFANKGIPERYWPTDAQLERLAAVF